MALVICLSGQIGSGKSSVSHEVARRLGWHRTGFGDFLRSELLRQGQDPSSREALQSLGQALVEADPKEFCRKVLAFGCFENGGNLLVDGIRHVEIQRTLAALVSPSVAKLIFLHADEEIRLDRVNHRDGQSDDFVRASNHRVEMELRDALPTIADALVDARKDLSSNVDEIISLVRRWELS